MAVNAQQHWRQHRGCGGGSGRQQRCWQTATATAAGSNGCSRQAVLAAHHAHWALMQPQPSSHSRRHPQQRLLLRAAMAAATVATSAAISEEDYELLEELVDAELWEIGLDPDSADPEMRQGLMAAVAALLEAGVGTRSAAAAVMGSSGWAEMSPEVGAALAAKVLLYRRWASEEPGAAAALVRALSAGDRLLDAAQQSIEEFEAALSFVAQQLPRLGGRQYEALHQPCSLARFVHLHPEPAGALLLQSPAAFQKRVAPWLSQRLLWDDAELAGAALSEWYTDLCHLDTTHVGRCLSWLCDGIGLSRRQAGALLASDLQLLVGSESDLEFRQAWVQLELLGHAAGVAHRPLAAALCLAQPARQLTALTADLTRRLAALLRDSVGMSEKQLLQFVVGGGLDGGCTLSPAALQRSKERVKHLLLVYGSWPATAAALAATPEVLHMSWQGLESLLAEAQQRAAWRSVSALMQQQEGHEQLSG